MGLALNCYFDFSSIKDEDGEELGMAVTSVAGEVPEFGVDPGKGLRRWEIESRIVVNGAALCRKGLGWSRFSVWRPAYDSWPSGVGVSELRPRSEPGLAFRRACPCSASRHRWQAIQCWMQSTRRAEYTRVPSERPDGITGCFLRGGSECDGWCLQRARRLDGSAAEAVH